MKRIHTNVFGSTLVLALGIVMLSGCSDDADSKPMAEEGKASLRVVHLSPDAPQVDIFVNGMDKAVEALPFAAGTGYLNIDEGMYDFSVAPNGGMVADSVLDINDITLSKGTFYTAVAYGMLSNISALALVDDYSDLDPGLIRVRAVHTADGVGEVDIWNIPEAGDSGLLYENVGYGVAGDYIDLPEGAYTIGFDVNNDAMPDLTFRLPALPAGTVANVFAVKDTSGVYLIAQMQDGGIATISPE